MNKTDSIEGFKSIVGDVVYAMPTGNTARGWNGKLECFDVVSVARKYIELRRNGSNYSDWYLPESGATKSAAKSGYGGNSGYMFFKTKECYLKHKEHSDLACDLSKKLRYFDYRLLSMSELKSIESIIKHVI